jgi:hypothetical protein
MDTHTSSPGSTVMLRFHLVRRLKKRHSFCYVVPHLGSTIVPSHPTLYRLNMWGSWVRRKDTTQVIYIANLKDGPKKVKKIFSMILERVFEMV